jgi:hypothetical protein
VTCYFRQLSTDETVRQEWISSLLLTVDDVEGNRAVREASPGEYGVIREVSNELESVSADVLASNITHPQDDAAQGSPSTRQADTYSIHSKDSNDGVSEYRLLLLNRLKTLLLRLETGLSSIWSFILINLYIAVVCTVCHLGHYSFSYFLFSQG